MFILPWSNQRFARARYRGKLLARAVQDCDLRALPASGGRDMYMDAFGWSTQSPAAPSCPGDDDDALLAAFLGASFELQCSEGGGDTVSSDVGYGLDLPPATQHGEDGVALSGSGPSTLFVDAVGLLQDIAGGGTAHDGLLDRFWLPSVAGAEEPARAAASNTAAFSGYSSTTGGGNISSGESNTYCGHDAEVASASAPACAMSQPVPPPSKRRLLDRYPATGASPSAATTTTGAERRSTKRAAATATNITFGRALQGRGYEQDTEAIAQVKEMIYRAAAMRPVSLGAGEPRPETKQRRKNVRISSDPQTVAARLRRERVSERLRALQRLVPGGSKMDTASMLDEAASYLKFLKSQLEALETLGNGGGGGGDNGRLLQHYAQARNTSRSDAFTGYVKSNRNMHF